MAGGGQPSLFDRFPSEASALGAGPDAAWERDAANRALPDLTVCHEGEVIYWEHLGMLDVPSYSEKWERKRKWYEANSFASRLITSQDGPDGSIDASEIEQIARTRILEE